MYEKLPGKFIHRHTLNRLYFKEIEYQQLPHFFSGSIYFVFLDNSFETSENEEEKPHPLKKHLKEIKNFASRCFYMCSFIAEVANIFIRTNKTGRWIRKQKKNSAFNTIQRQ